MKVNTMRRRFVAVAAAAILAAITTVTAEPALAADPAYPSKAIRLVVPWPPGGLVDIAARVVAEKLQAALGQPVIVDNKAGAGGVIGADIVAKAAPDGYTLALTTSALNMNAAMGTRLPFDVQKDLQPLVNAALVPSILVVHPAKGAKSVQDLVAAARAAPGKMNYASAGNGTPAHYSAELLKTLLGLEITHVAYKGAPPALVDQMAGLVDFHFANATVALPQVKAGKLRALAVTSAKRMPELPDVPTMAEAGVPGFEADQWVGFLAPGGLPQPVADLLVREISKILADPSVREQFAKNGMTTATAASPAEFAAYLKSDLAKWQTVARKAAIKPD